MSSRDKDLGSKVTNAAYGMEQKIPSNIKEQAAIIKDQASDLKDSLKQEARNIYNEGEKKARETYAQVKDYTADTKDELTRSLSNFVEKDPIKALALAALAGAFLAFIMKK